MIFLIRETSVFAAVHWRVLLGFANEERILLSSSPASFARAVPRRTNSDANRTPRSIAGAMLAVSYGEVNINMRSCRKFDKIDNPVNLHLLSPPNGSKTKSAAKFVWGLAILPPQRGATNSGGSGQIDRHSPHDIDHMGTDGRHAGPEGNLPAGESVSGSHPKAAAYRKDGF